MMPNAYFAQTACRMLVVIVLTAPLSSMTLGLPLTSASTQKKESAANKDKLNDYIAIIRAQRTRAENRVQRIKETFPAKDGKYDPKYIKAQSLYADTYSEFDGLLAAIKVAIIKNGGKEASFDAALDRAVKANKAFCDYGDTALGRDKEAFSEELIVKAAVGIWNFIRQVNNKRKEEFASYVESQTKWQKWNDIK